MAPQCNKDWGKRCSLLCSLALQKQVDPLTDNGPCPTVLCKIHPLKAGKEGCRVPLTHTAACHMLGKASSLVQSPARGALCAFHPRILSG